VSPGLDGASTDAAAGVGIGVSVKESVSKPGVLLTLAMAPPSVTLKIVPGCGSHEMTSEPAL